MFYEIFCGRMDAVVLVKIRESIYAIEENSSKDTAYIQGDSRTSDHGGASGVLQEGALCHDI